MAEVAAAGSSGRAGAGSGARAGGAPDPYLVEPITGPVDATVRVPGSKSLTNRALVCAALAEGRSRLPGALLADDTEAMLDCLDRLGIPAVAYPATGGVTAGADAGPSGGSPPGSGLQRDAVADAAASRGVARAAGPDPDGWLEVQGCGGVIPVPAGPATLDARLSGTTSRFVLPILPLAPGPVRLDGAPSLRARPMADGIAALRALGVEVREEGEPGRLPVTVVGQGDRARGRLHEGTPDPAVAVRPAPPEGAAGLPPAAAGGPPRLVVAGDASSQFLSGLLLAAPAWPAGLEVAVDGHLVSRPYVDMTVAVMRGFGAEVAESPGTWTVAPTGYRAGDHRIEPDASAASYFFAAAAILGGRVTVAGLGRGSLQGDLEFVDVLARMGCQVRQGRDATTVTAEPGALRGVDVDLADLSDTAQTLAAVAVFAGSPTRVRGIGFIRHKETDRVGNVVAELRRCGIRADEEPDGFVVHPGEPRPATVRTYDDHRMAMSFALLGLRAPGIGIADPGCVAKTFPGYWDALDQLR